MLQRDMIDPFRHSVAGRQAANSFQIVKAMLPWQAGLFLFVLTGHFVTSSSAR